MERIFAVIVTYNRKALLEECLEAVASQALLPDKVLVVDNHSTDGTPELFSDFKRWGVLEDRIIVYRTVENIGCAGGLYVGIAKAMENGADAIWIMDDDTIPNEHTLENLVTSLAGRRIPLAASQASSDGQTTPCTK